MEKIIKKRKIKILICSIFIMSIFYVAYCQNSIRSYKITFDSNNGSGDVPVDMIAKKNTNIIIPKANLVKDGKAITAWTTNPDGTGVRYVLDAEDEFKCDTTLYACYNQNVKCDTLVLMYMDADGNLNDSIFENIKETERGLFKIKKQFPKKYGNVVVAILWDGAKTTEDDQEIFYPNTQLYELGYEDCEDNYYEFSRKTMNVSDTTNGWISKTDSREDDVVELDVSKISVFSEFLNWASSRYDTNRLIIQLSDHGGGARAVCWDYTPGAEKEYTEESFLKTKQVAAVIKKYFKHIDLLLQDACFMGSIEDAYEYKDCVDVMISSPNIVPGCGFDYTSLMENLTIANTNENIAKSIINSFKKKSQIDSDQWMGIKNKYSKESWLKRSEKQTLYMSNEIPTLTATRCAKLGDVRKKLNDFFGVVNECGEVYEGLKRSIAILENDNFEGTYFNYSKNGDEEISNQEALRALALNQVFPEINYNPNFLYFSMYTFTYDLGRFMDIICENFDSQGANPWPELVEKAKEVQLSLDDAIIDSWRSSYKGINSGHGSNADMYYKSSKSNKNYSNGWYGLTIMGGENTLIVDDKNDPDDDDNNPVYDITYSEEPIYYEVESYPEFYKELSFGKDCDNYFTFLENMFPR